ncbi:MULTISPECIES: pirin-like bicupin family protein [unclassified Paenibacillus]|uniref:pirin family protein n=1 Tax=unclassified Paenibacillus TaxID=185978 RepID=UPI0024075F37|nr:MULTISPECIES: pirin-like bicupin family protein [unclassified Paenibacillus]MDF9842429.1 redox-sensitive bicupin YhaK (pirin superfamily) [Paenibacillus sp. PastF-2]MDF9849019.1 redox-sensitive bicupin YhaK (pirin superfamily) [Paenibacillus sp. PastM-2]MDF9855589.1 redox-sensitive bicupin YhaK (pirin superfamily) [Paenibacillus sp. PastF-1]MDH6480861.1 redox-sensitive bicupin YhaK (pirin superfamily) [Paenibacillus sp. PastH-2]MDH6508283.1 redox-sensitive bicupin YhaK (pirin superfamily) [
MIKVYPAASAHRFDHGWLKGSHSFSFGDFYDPDNTAFGPMRVCNDDTIAPGRGFGAHPHSDMEIVSIVLSGRLRHEDNLGNVAETEFGGVQRMSAGTGAIHTEHNPSDTEPVRLLQLWFMPRTRGTAPSYTTGRFDPARLEGRLLPVVAPERTPEIVDIAQDMTIYLGRAAAGRELALEQEAGRRIFVYLIEGQVKLPDGQLLQPGDSARIEGISRLALASGADTLVMVIDLP